jgi:hemerythrin-like domain-containing protein
MTKRLEHSRRQFLRVGTSTGAGLLVAGSTVAMQIGPIGEGEEEKPISKNSGSPEEMSPAEDLMREHGVLNRILLIYEEYLRRFGDKEGVEPTALAGAAKIVRTFIEDYHEKLEEDHLFPCFEKAGKLVDLVKVLRDQHQAGRRLTDKIARLATQDALQDAQGNKELAQSLRQFIRMYRPHESREDTVLFPAIRSLMTTKEYDDLGEQFEDREHQLFGEHGFEDIVGRVTEFEKTLGIYDLSQFTA